MNEDQNLKNYQSTTELNISNNSMLVIMDGLIKTMQQLQEMFIYHPVVRSCDENNIHELKKNENEKSQAALLLHQVQSAMEATIAQLSSNKLLKPIESSTSEDDTIDHSVTKENLTVSEKWRMYTELVQMKNESSKEYCIMKMKLGQELGLSFNETKREMVIGLWNNRLSIVLHLKNHKNEDDILNDIEEWEKIESARNDIIKKYRQRNK